MPEFPHLNADNNPAMVDVGRKAVTRRTARAQSIVSLGPSIMRHLNSADITTKKGPVFQTTIIAGTMAAKRTDDPIPLCHSLGLDNCQIITADRADVIIPAADIYLSVMQWVGATNILVPDLGLKDGIIQLVYNQLNGRKRTP